MLPRQTIIADKNYFGRVFEQELADAGITLLHGTRNGEWPRPGQRFPKPLRQVIESINEALQGQLDLEAHGNMTITGATIRVLQQLLAHTAAIWHSTHTGMPVLRSLTAYDH